MISKTIQHGKDYSCACMNVAVLLEDVQKMSGRNINEMQVCLLSNRTPGTRFHGKNLLYQYRKFHSLSSTTQFNSSPPAQNGSLFADNIFRSIFVNENFCILIKISLQFVPKGLIDNNPALVQIMAWR